MIGAFAGKDLPVSASPHHANFGNRCHSRTHVPVLPLGGCRARDRGSRPVALACSRSAARLVRSPSACTTCHSAIPVHLDPRTALPASSTLSYVWPVARRTIPPSAPMLAQWSTPLWVRMISVPASRTPAFSMSATCVRRLALRRASGRSDGLCDARDCRPCGRIASLVSIRPSRVGSQTIAQSLRQVGLRSVPYCTVRGSGVGADRFARPIDRRYSPGTARCAFWCSCCRRRRVTGCRAYRAEGQQSERRRSGECPTGQMRPSAPQGHTGPAPWRCVASHG